MKADLQYVDNKTRIFASSLQFHCREEIKTRFINSDKYRSGFYRLI